MYRILKPMDDVPQYFLSIRGKLPQFCGTHNSATLSHMDSVLELSCVFKLLGGRKGSVVCVLRKLVVTLGRMNSGYMTQQLALRHYFFFFKSKHLKAGRAKNRLNKINQ